MVHVVFDGSLLRIENFLQRGGGVLSFEGYPLYQRGHGYFVGFPRQRGHGLGSLFQNLWRFIRPIATNFGKAALPIAKSAGRAIGEEGLATSARIINDLVQGKNLKESITDEGREGVRKLLEKASSNLKKQEGSGLIKRKRKRGSTLIHTDKQLIGRSVPRKALVDKKLRIDSLGPY